MARGSKKAEAQSKNSSGKRASDRVALKEAGAKAGSGRKAAAARAQQEELDFREPRIFDDRTRRDIAGVLCGVVAVALFIIAVLPPSGFITSALSQGLHLGLGFGCYLLPIMMLATGVCMLVRTEHSHLGLRVGIGSFLILIALMSILALFTPGAATDPGAVIFASPGFSMIAPGAISPASCAAWWRSRSSSSRCCRLRALLPRHYRRGSIWGSVLGATCFPS